MAGSTNGATALKPFKPTKTHDKLIEQLRELDGQRVTVTRKDGDPVTGVLAPHKPADNDEPRFKVGARVVSLSNTKKVEATPAEDKPASEPVGYDGDVAALILNYVEAHHSTDPDAPSKGVPFVQNDRVYLQLEGRVTGGLLAYARSESKTDDVGKAALRKQIEELGFTRKPFSYHHSDKGQTSASYYSIEAKKLGGKLDVPNRQARERQTGKRASQREEVKALIEKATIPVRPEGSPEDVARCQELEQAYNDARAAWRTAAMRKRPADEQDAAKQAARDAQAEWQAHRRAMVERNKMAVA